MDYLTNDTDLTAVADAIREKGGTSTALEWPSGYVDAIDAIETGGGGSVESVEIKLNLAFFAITNIAWVDANGLVRTDYETEVGETNAYAVFSPVIGSMLVIRPNGPLQSTAVPYCELAATIVLSGSGPFADKLLIYKVTG